MRLEELTDLLARHARPDAGSAIDRVGVTRVDRPHAPVPAMTGTALAVMAQGTKHVALGEQLYEHRAGQFLVASVDLPIVGQFIEAAPEAPALCFVLRLDPSVIAELLFADSDQTWPGPDEPVPGIVVADAPAELLDAVVRMMRLLDAPRDVAVLAPLLEREILWRLITGDQGETVRRLGLADSSLNHIARAAQWIREHYAEPFRVEDVARIAGMSVSAFHRNFQAVTAMSPIQYRTRIRLQEARFLLSTRPGDITGVSRLVGYESPSQFSREYRRQFGAPPSLDAARPSPVRPRTASHP